MIVSRRVRASCSVFTWMILSRRVKASCSVFTRMILPRRVRVSCSVFTWMIVSRRVRVSCCVFKWMIVSRRVRAFCNLVDTQSSQMLPLLVPSPELLIPVETTTEIYGRQNRVCWRFFPLFCSGNTFGETYNATPYRSAPLQLVKYYENFNICVLETFLYSVYLLSRQMINFNLFIRAKIFIYNETIYLTRKVIKFVYYY